jgi:hypothetical protein
MSYGARVEAGIIWTVRAALALLMLLLIPVYAVLVFVAYPIALVVTSSKPVAPRPVRVRVAT